LQKLLGTQGLTEDLQNNEAVESKQKKKTLFEKIAPMPFNDK